MKKPALLVLLWAAMAGTGCGHLPGKPGPEPEVGRPDQVVSFPALYKQNCISCHGDNQHPGPAIPLENPMYLAVAGEGTIRDVLNHGVPGGLMPAFGQSGGGMLTDQQVQILAHGLVATYGKPDMLNGLRAPTYRAALHPDVAAGRRVFTTYCARCHGDAGQGADVVGAIVDPSFLALISDQNLRSIVIAGLPMGMPNFHDQDPDHPLTDQNVTDVVAWVASHRTSVAPSAASSSLPESISPRATAHRPSHEPASTR